MSFKNRYINVILGLGLLMSLILFITPHSFIERVYGQGLFVIIRLIISPFVWLPVPLVYLLMFGVVFYCWRVLRLKRSFLVRLIYLVVRLCVIILLFYWMWAFNYRRIGFEARYPLVVQHSLDSAAMSSELNMAITTMVQNRPSITIPLTSIRIETLIRPSVRTAVNHFGYSTPGLVRVKELWPRGMLLRIKTAGFYLPFAGEAYIDAGLHAIQKPFTMAHEMSHGFGVTDEGACNFLAYMATINHPDSSIRYSAALGYYRYVAGEYLWRYPQAYMEVRKSLPVEVQKDLDDINRQMLKYPDIFPRLRDKIYDKYLTVQGVKEGLASYDKIIDYVRQARAQGLIEAH